MPRKVAKLADHPTVGDKGIMPLHRGMPTLGAKPDLVGHHSTQSMMTFATGPHFILSYLKLCILA
ncbi:MULTISPECIES: hypothetical protein [Virgibacillus]|uniref:Uncharacterized protein n=1 Tax=Virgibacillus kapii TaxID=1638645 RepID=A0ABQ2DUL4_9BACI|nr:MULTISPECIES: hypothetical protein [Virgibacillus]EQB37896.1 hypothetical protein M948_04840 [Virgibacillus sp. CM-4]MYL40622.1 hypothetical protein [Virgibacillus massiliensis]GGJ73399.1 hypothetical protein GCM10007111_38760 [Virgibacillus kapii]